MTWTPITDAEMAMARHVVTWIRTAREAGYGSDWLPDEADMSKSALLERLRSGKDPLPEPPPLGMSCPWYALVEDPGPHYVFDVWRGGEGLIIPADLIVVLQTPFKIVEECGEKDFIVRDAGHDTSYRFHLWFDPQWKAPERSVPRILGGWFIRNVVFEKAIVA